MRKSLQAREGSEYLWGWCLELLRTFPFYSQSELPTYTPHTFPMRPHTGTGFRTQPLLLRIHWTTALIAACILDDCMSVAEPRRRW
jgi:hypothetical protein